MGSITFDRNCVTYHSLDTHGNQHRAEKHAVEGTRKHACIPSKACLHFFHVQLLNVPMGFAEQTLNDTVGDNFPPHELHK
jgi:hypothetical protein